MKISVTVNGHLYDRDVEDHWTLLRFLRESVGLTGTKEGCAAGECGACTVALNGKTVNSCLVLAAEADGASVDTIEGEAHDGELSSIQAAFARNHAVQCGFCTGRHDHVGQGSPAQQSQTERCRDQSGHRGQLLPLHRIRADHRGRAGRIGATHPGDEGGVGVCLSTRTGRRCNPSV